MGLTDLFLPPAETIASAPPYLVCKDTVSRVWRTVGSDWDAWNARLLIETKKSKIGAVNLRARESPNV